MVHVFYVLKLVVTIFFVVVAERPRISERALQSDPDISGKEHCPHWLVLRSVLAKLGITEPTPHLDRHIIWKRCYVEEIHLAGEQAITGTLDSEIGKLQTLRQLTLRHTKVTGDLSTLRHLTKLKRLTLDNTQVTGDLLKLQRLSHLQTLSLDNTEVRGDLLSLRHLVHLRTLSLDNTKVTGDLSSLRNLVHLQDLYLSNTWVAGDLFWSLQGLVELRELYLDDTKVAGPISSLQGLIELQKLKLDNTKVAGDISSLQGLVNLQRLSLDSTKVDGDISSLQGLVDLQKLSLDSIKVEGDISSLQHLVDMQEIYLSNTKVEGNISSLQGLFDLQRLSLDSTQVAGDLTSMQNLTKLDGLFLTNTKVTGDISSLQGLVDLQELSLDSTKVEGDISSLQHLVDLQELSLDSTKGGGDISSLQGLVNLQKLSLDSTKVEGDISSLQGLVDLQKLSLYSAKVEGDISSLQHLVDMQEIYLDNTKVEGNISSLQGLVDLQEIYLDDSKVTGDISSLQGLVDLQELSLSNTKVEGDISSMQSLTKLEVLYLSNTKVEGNISSLQGLFDLQKLSLDSTQVAGDLTSMQSLTKLDGLSLTNTKVTGDISSLQGLVDLQKLFLENTKVLGDLASLQNLTNVHELHLASTFVAGDLTGLLLWNHVTTINLEQTHVSGRLSAKWRGRWSTLRSLKLSRSQVKFLPQPDELLQLESSFFTSSDLDFAANAILPQLNLLELNGCPLDGDVGDLLLPLCGSAALTTIEAARCRLSGTLPSLKLATTLVDGATWLDWDSLLAKSLKVLNLGSNNITQIKGIPEEMQVLVLAENWAVDFADGVLRDALTRGTFLDLRNVALSNTTEAAELLKKGLIVKTEQVSLLNSEAGYQCHSIESTALQITPPKFLPQELCMCSAGFEGAGAQCYKCGQNTYSEGNSSICKPCPEGTMAGEGEATCKCTSGGKFFPDQSPACQCPAEYGLFANLKASNGNETLTETCVPCHKAHLRCPSSGMLLTSSPPEIGFARLRENDTEALPCLPPKDTRCNSTDSNASTHFGCASGYAGVLCSDCEAKHYLTKNACTPCPASETTQQIWSAVSVAGCVGMLVVAVLTYMWLRRVGVAASTSETSSVVAPFSAFGAFKEQTKQLAPMLLQTCQLWAVVGVLMKGESGRGSSDSWEIPFVEALTLLYVGGASGAAKLLRCQEVDGQKGRLPPEFAFRKSVPHLLCHDSSMTYLDAVGYSSIVFYGLVVPLCLAYLFARQHLALLAGKTTVALAVESGHQRKVRLVEINTVETSSRDVPKGEVAHIKLLLAASAAHIAVNMKGLVRVTLKDGVVVATPSSGDGHVSNEDPEASRGSGSIEDEWRLEDLSSLVGKNSSGKTRDLTEALMDRCLLEEAESSDRALAGCKHILFKYLRCQSFYMEIIQKLVAVALVSVVNSDDGLQLSLAITLLMAAANGMVQPYFHPQANRLQCCSFLCLALAAVGFSYERTWLSRGALAVPFLLSAGLALRPDSTESLAVRIWRQMEKELRKLQDGESLEILVETVSFV